jgi:hypothetical protein
LAITGAERDTLLEPLDRVLQHRINASLSLHRDGIIISVEQFSIYDVLTIHDLGDSIELQLLPYYVRSCEYYMKTPEHSLAETQLEQRCNQDEARETICTLSFMACSAANTS